MKPANEDCMTTNMHKLTILFSAALLGAGLWFYVLKEAEIEQNGLRLGSVGGRIVGEVFVGLLKNDPSSYLAAQPNWTPELPAAAPSDFRVTDLLRFAGVVVDAP